METKTCSRCKEVKDVGEFSKDSRSKSGLVHACKQCIREYYQANRIRILDKQKTHYQVNREVIAAQKREYHRVNRDELRGRMKEYRQANCGKRKQYYQTHRIKINERTRSYISQRYQTNPQFKLMSILRRHTQRVKSKFGTKSRSAQLLSCSWEEAQAHLIQTAVTNYGFYDEVQDYHVDHITPLSSATTEAEAIALSHISNLQYLTPEDNIAKADRLDWQLTTAS